MNEGWYTLYKTLLWIIASMICVYFFARILTRGVLDEINNYFLKKFKNNQFKNEKQNGKKTYKE